MTLFGQRIGTRVALWLAMCVLGLLTACSNFTARPDTTPQDVWQGRLAVNISADPALTFSANFALQGSARAGVLALTGVLGTRVATLRWSEGSATLQTPQELLEFESVDAMLTRSLGAPLPLSALFGWLQGETATPAGWEVDLHDLPAGRIRARRMAPEAIADIQIILEPR